MEIGSLRQFEPESTQSENLRLLEIAEENSRRRLEALRLYRTIPEPVRTLQFHLSMASERLLRGGVQSGKTTAAAAEIASAACGIPLLDSRGRELKHKYNTDRPLLIWVTGFDEAHIGGVIYKKLFAPGAFDLILDRKTKQPRVWKPWLAEDENLEDETFPSPPLIPTRMLEKEKGKILPDDMAYESPSFSWINKGMRHFALCRLINGTEIWAFPSGGSCPKGQAVDLIWIDEDIKESGHVAEWQSRLSKRRGRLIWSAWPYSRNDALVNMSQRAEDDAGKENPDVEEIVLRFMDNPYMPEDEIRKRLKGWSPEEARSRNLGEFLTDSILVFPAFSKEVQTIGGRGCPDALTLRVTDNNFRPPLDWTHYLILDPGHTQPAVLFAAVPPPEFGDHVVLYDEVYTPLADAAETASEVVQKANGVPFEAFIIDTHAGKRTPEGHSMTVMDRYSRAFEAQGLRSAITGSGFILGNDNISARNMIVREWMMMRPNSTTKLLLIDQNMPNIQREFRLYKKRITRNDVLDDVVNKNNHLCDCLGYLAAYDPKYVHRPDKKAQESVMWRVLHSWRKRTNTLPATHICLGAGAFNPN